MNNNSHFILSASCKLVKGYTRSVIIDYSRGDLYFITHEYMEIVEKIDRNSLNSVIDKLEDEESNLYFVEFLSFLIENEIGFLAEDPACFPKINDVLNEDFVVLQDVILEIDETCFEKINFIKLCEDLKELRCLDYQIRLLSTTNINFLDKILEVINNTKPNYLEIHCTYEESITMDLLHKFIEENSYLSKIYIYNSPFVKIHSVINEIPNCHPISLGEIYFIDYPFDNGNCCGIINYENLNFTSFYLHNKLKTKNGCLDKKITIDKFGNIKNCPSMGINYGNIDVISIKEVLKQEAFTKIWNINKDQISVCKVCEFRYNCTDCRAFIQNEDDIYSKPLKCSYNPITCRWEDNFYSN